MSSAIILSAIPGYSFHWASGHSTWTEPHKTQHQKSMGTALDGKQECHAQSQTSVCRKFFQTSEIKKSFESLKNVLKLFCSQKHPLKWKFCPIRDIRYIIVCTALSTQHTIVFFLSLFFFFWWELYEIEFIRFLVFVAQKPVMALQRASMSVQSCVFYASIIETTFNQPCYKKY